MARLALALAAALASACGAPPAAAAPASACRLPNKQARRDVAIGFPLFPYRMRATGVVNVSVLFVDFPDAAAERSPAETLALLAPAAGWYAEVSYGAMRLVLTPLLETLRMPLNSSAYSFRTVASQRHYLAEATKLAAARKGAAFDFSESESVVVLATPRAGRALPNGPAFCATPGQGFKASGRTFDNSVTSGADFDFWLHKWLNHEMGHTMGLVDLYSYGGGPEFGYTGDWSIMGHIAGAGGSYFGWERFLLGWMPDARVACVTEPGSSTVVLAPLNDAALGDAPRLAVVRVAPELAVCLELRAALGLDRNITQPGVLVYVVDTRLQSGYGPIQVLPLNSSDRTMMSSTLSAPGAALEYAGVRVELLSITKGGEALVNVTGPGMQRPSSSPAPPAPAGAASAAGSLERAWAYIGGGLAGGLVLIAILVVAAGRLGAWRGGAGALEAGSGLPEVGGGSPDRQRVEQGDGEFYESL